MSREEVYESLTTTFMNNAVASELFGFKKGAGFDDEFSRVSLVRLLFYVVSYVIALKETKLQEWKDAVQSVAEETHYGTASWWIAKAKSWQEGDGLSIIDGKVDYPTVRPEKRVITAASVTVNGRVLNLKVAKGESGNLQGLNNEQLSSFAGYVEQIKPLGIKVNCISGTANILRLYGEVRYKGERLQAEVERQVIAALNDMLQNIEFNGTIYTSKIVQTVMNVDGVASVHIGRYTMDNRDWIDSVVPDNGYAVLNATNLTFRAR